MLKYMAIVDLLW